ncbi:MAG: flap endonuclease Xni [Psychrobium sp.]|nr:flap endonuclease Xni [Psychrobium sp.]
MKHKQPMIHLVIIDALNLIRRIDGALRGFSSDASLDSEQLINLTLQALKKLIRGHQPTHIVAIFDGDGNNWRKALYPQYKHDRKPMAEDLALLLPKIIEQWQDIGVASYQPPHDEADDIIATLSTKIAQRGAKCTVISTDLGFLQLLSQQTKVWDHFASQWQDEQLVQKKFNVSSRQLLDYWAIVGQSGNKIPGVAGMGPKAALTLLTQFGTLKDAFSAQTDEKNKLLSKLHNNKQPAQLSYQLVRLKKDIALGVNLHDFIYRQPH